MAICGIYAVVLRHRPNVHPPSFLVAAMGIGSCMILPFYISEMAQGAVSHGDFSCYMAMADTAVVPSFVACRFFNRGVELFGAGHAGQSMRLMPPFGSILAVPFLGKRLRIYHEFGMSSIAAGILLASQHPFRPALPAARAS